MNTTSRRTIAISATGAAVAGALCFGAAAPALAHDSANGQGTKVGFFTAPTLDQQKAWFTTFIENWQAWLNKWADKVANSDQFTAAQKADYAAQVAAATKSLDDLKAAVAAATTQDELKSALQTGFGSLQWPTWPKAQQPAPVKLTDAQQLANKKAHVLAKIDRWESWLDSWAAKVAASDKLTDAQKADYAAQLATAKQSLDALKAAVNAATTLDELKTALKNGWSSFQWPKWPAGFEHKKFDPKSFGWGNFDPSKSGKTFTSKDSHPTQSWGAKAKSGGSYGPTAYGKAGTYTVKADSSKSHSSTGHGGFGH